MKLTLTIDGYPLDKDPAGEMSPGQIIAVLGSLARQMDHHNVIIPGDKWPLHFNGYRVGDAEVTA
jgi:hypothetical protein